MRAVIFEAYVEQKAPAVRFLPNNATGRDFVVGDIHGCTDAFWEGIKDIGFCPDRDRMFSVGDLIDRGPDSIGALELLKYRWFHAVRGNHEQLMLDAIRANDPRAQRMWISNGGKWATELPTQSVEALCDIVEQLPLALVVGSGRSRFNVIHAEFIGSDSELESGKWSSASTERLLWGRSLIGSDFPPRNDQLSTTFCGHTVVSNVTTKSSHIFLDTGAYLANKDRDRLKGRLTIIEINLDYPAITSIPETKYSYL